MDAITVEGTQVTLTTVTGDVAGSGKRSDSYVSGGGGGGHGDYRQPVSISTTVVVTQEFFLRRDDGKEAPYKIVDLDIPIRDGQRASMLLAGTNGKGDWPVRLVNHSAERYWAVNAPRKLAQELGLAERSRTTTLKVLGLWAAGMFLPFGFGWFVAGVAYGIVKYLHCGKVAKELTGHFDRVANQLLSSAPVLPAA